MSAKRLLLDINSIVPYFTCGHATGVGRSTMELVKALNDFTGLPFELVLFSQNTKGIGVHNTNTPHKKLHFFFPRRKPFTSVSNALKLKRHFSHYDLLHIPHNTDKWEDIHSTIYTIHDLIVYRYPEMWGLTDAERKEHKFIARNCKAIVTCSEASRQDIIKFWGCSPEKVTAIPWGVNRDVFKPDYAPITSIPELKKSFFFSSSCNHPRKQTALLLKAYEEYINLGGTSQLVLLNPSSEDVLPFLYLSHAGHLIVLNGISDSVLVKLYSQAKASIVVSLYEGFGLPVLESLACNTQVICARNSSLTEAGGNVVDYIDNPSIDTLSKKLFEYDSIEKVDTLDIACVERHLSRFTWKNCAQSYIKFWEKQLFQSSQ